MCGLFEFPLSHLPATPSRVPAPPPHLPASLLLDCVWVVAIVVIVVVIIVDASTLQQYRQRSKYNSVVILARAYFLRRVVTSCVKSNRVYREQAWVSERSS